MARWRSGYAEDCKSLHAGSIPARASKCVAQTGAISRHSWFLGARVPIFIGMTFSDLSDWQSVALVALGVWVS